MARVGGGGERETLSVGCSVWLVVVIYVLVPGDKFKIVSPGLTKATY